MQPNSAYEFICRKFPAKVRNPRVLFQSESSKHEWRPSDVCAFWRSRRWRIPISQDSELDAPVTPESNTDRESVSDGEFAENLARRAV